MDRILHQPYPDNATTSISNFFIENILREEKLGENTGFDFTMEQIQYLCESEPKNCKRLLDSLSFSSSDVRNDTTSLVDAGTGNQSSKNENEIITDIIAEKDDYSYEALSNIPGPGDKIYKFLGLPRHILILALIPFFPVMLFFTASGGAAFFVTTGIEFLLR